MEHLSATVNKVIGTMSVLAGYMLNMLALRNKKIPSLFGV
jgi:hypothetical protein